MARYRKRSKPEDIIDAVQWTGKNTKKVCDWPGIVAHPCYVDTEKNNYFTIEIKTLEGPMYVYQNEWIIKGIEGEFYIIRPDIFEKTYEKVDD